jgi:hypothetical protein
VSVLHHDARRDAFDFTSHFREDFYACLTRRGDTLFELTDAMLCEDGPVTSPVDLPLLAEHRRGHGALYDALNCGRIDVDRLRKALAMLPQPKAAPPPLGEAGRTRQAHPGPRPPRVQEHPSAPALPGPYTQTLSPHSIPWRLVVAHGPARTSAGTSTSAPSLLPHSSSGSVHDRSDGVRRWLTCGRPSEESPGHSRGTALPQPMIGH